MNCIEARRMVTPYVNRELSPKDTEAFLDHIENCSDCMDELDVYFIVNRALNSLDTGEHQEFNFKKLLKEDIRMNRRSIFRRKIIFLTRMILLAAVLLMILFGIYIGYERTHGAAPFSFERSMHQLYISPVEKRLKLKEKADDGNKQLAEIEKTQIETG